MNRTAYAGLASVPHFADFGHVVTCIEQGPSKIEREETGEIPVFECGLEHCITRNVLKGRLAFGLAVAEAITSSNAVFKAVKTPTWRWAG